jgi:hypothetical protein
MIVPTKVLVEQQVHVAKYRLGNVKLTKRT